MEHDTHALSRSYQLLNSASPCNHIAEEPAKYSLSKFVKYNTDTSTAEPVEPADPAGPAESAAPATSTLLTEHHRQGQTLRLAMALLEGTHHAATDQQASIDRLRTLTRKATGRADTPHRPSLSARQSDDALLKRLRQLVRSEDRNLAE